MPGTYVIVVLLIVVALLIFMVSKLKCHAVIELLSSTLKNVHVPLNQNLLQEDDSLAQIKMSRFTAVMPIIGQTATDVFMPSTTLAEVMSFIGALLSVLIIGCLLAVFTQIKGWWKREDVRNTWISKAMTDCAGPVFITALGGSLAAFIKGAGIAETLAEMVADAGIPSILVPMAHPHRYRLQHARREHARGLSRHVLRRHHHESRE